MCSMYSNSTWQPVDTAAAEIPSETPPVAVSDTFSDIVTDESSNMPSDAPLDTPSIAPSKMSSETLSDTHSEAPSGTPYDTIPTTFKMTSLAVYAEHSVGLWQPNHPIIYLIMKSTSSTSDPTFPHEPAEPLAHCPTLGAAHKTLEDLAQQYPGGTLTKKCESVSFQMAGNKTTQTFWVKEVGHVRALKWMDFGEEEDDAVETSDGDVEAEMCAGEDERRNESASGGGLGHVFPWMNNAEESGVCADEEVYKNESTTGGGLSHVFPWMKNSEAVE